MVHQTRFLVFCVFSQAKIYLNLERSPLSFFFWIASPNRTDELHPPPLRVSLVTHHPPKIPQPKSRRTQSPSIPTHPPATPRQHVSVHLINTPPTPQQQHTAAGKFFRSLSPTYPLTREFTSTIRTQQSAKPW